MTWQGYLLFAAVYGFGCFVPGPAVVALLGVIYGLAFLARKFFRWKCNSRQPSPV